MDALEDIKSLFTVLTDVVYGSVLCSTEENICSNDTSDTEETNVEVESATIKLAVVPKVIIGVFVVEVTDDGNKEEYSVELESF